jgi:hypothetical protein
VKLNIVPARTGIQWVKLGVKAFFRQPLGLAGLLFMYGAAMLLLAVIPPWGLAAPLLMPAATLGMLVAAQRVDTGSFPMPSVLIAGFRAGKQCTRALLVLGVVHVAVWGCIYLVLQAIFPGPFVQMNEAAQGTPPTARVSPALSIAAVLWPPVVFLFSFAPALVYWHAVTPAKSLFFSAVAFWRNLGAFITFAATWFLLLALLGLVLGLLSGGNTMLLLQILAPFGFICFYAMLFASLYFSFRDTFVATAEEPAPN